MWRRCVIPVHPHLLAPARAGLLATRSARLARGAARCRSTACVRSARGADRSARPRPRCEAHRLRAMSSTAADDPAARRRAVATTRCGATSASSATRSGACSSSRTARICWPTSSASGASLARPGTRARRPTERRSRPACARSARSARRPSCARSALYFQLANVAEAWHRVRSRRRYEREEQIPRESLAEAFGRLADERRGAGGAGPPRARASRSSS